MKNKNNNLSGGYIALMATIIISLILLVMTIEEGSSGWYARFNILGTEAKEQANSLAEGCAEQAMARLLTDPTYTGNTVTTTSLGTCETFPIQLNYPTAGLVTIRTQAVVKNSYANLDMAMNMNDIHFGSIPSAPSTGTLFITTHVINDSSGTRTASDFMMSVSANPNSTFPGTESGNAVIIQPGAYSISEVALLPNYSKSVSSNCSGNILAGEIKFCTITYDDITTTISVIANVINNNNGTSTPSNFPLFIDGNPVTLGSRINVTPGAHVVSATTLSGYAVSPWGFDCSAAGNVTMTAGQNKTCVVNFDDLPPPAPSCADTVMMLDRTGSMSSADLSNERVAANSLVNLYAGVLPPAAPPQLGVGVFGDGTNNTGLAPARITAQLTTLYNSLTASINSWLGSSEGYTNLGDAIKKASDELNSVRHIPGNEKVIIIVSDGEPNRPTGSLPYDTDFKSPTANSQNATGDNWNNAIGAYTDAGTNADDVANQNDRHQFSNFGFGNGAGLPTGATVRGIEAKMDAWATGGVVNTPGNSSRTPSGNIAPNSWTNPTRANNNDDSYTTSSVNGAAQGFSNFGFTIPSNATITGIQVSTEAKINGGSVTSGTLFTNDEGNYDDWNNYSESAIDETGTVNCSSSNEYISENSTNSRASFEIDINSIPNGSIITGINITVYDRADSSSSQDGTYRTFARLNNNNTDASTNLSATGTTSCTPKTQTIDLSDTVKNSGTDLEIGVVKTSGDSSTVRIGAIRATVTYIPPTTGSMDVSLSWNNGTNYTGAKNIPLTSIETVSTPTGNSVSDLWNRTWTPADFNNGNFAVRVANNSTNGAIVSLDELNVNVFYTVPTATGVSCQIGVDLSWNGGASWTSEKIQNINGTETTYILGAANDDWTSHTWTPQDFSNANFRARIHGIDPGSGCDNTAVEHLDLLQLKVHYTQTVDPIEAALNAADAAKLAGVNIFTIHFGDDPGPYAGRRLLANLASGGSPVTYSAGHQNGSFADAGGATTGNTGLVSPTAQSPDTGGDGNGFQTNPNNAFSDGPSGTNGAAQNIDGPGDRHRFSGYNFTIPPNAVITGIQTRLDWWLNDTSGSNSMNVELSWDGGASWTAPQQDVNESTFFFNSRTLGGATNTWGRSWTAAELTPANFRVRVTMNSSVSSRDFYLDWIPVTISYSVNTENADGDNFFIAPTSSDMQGIFNFIGEQVCPASLNLAATPPPTTSLLNVITQVTNNNSGTNVASDFTASVNATNPTPSSFPGNASGVNVTLDPGNYSVTESGLAGYSQIIGSSCTSAGSLGPIVAGETRVCVITNDDLPPPPPPPNLNFNTDSWREIPTAN